MTTVNRTRLMAALLVELLAETESPEGNQAKPESDSTACPPAGCGQLEQVTAGRPPDREMIAEMMTYLEGELESIGTCYVESDCRAPYRHRCEKILQHLELWNRA